MSGERLRKQPHVSHPVRYNDDSIQAVSSSALARFTAAKTWFPTNKVEIAANNIFIWISDEQMI